MSNTKLTIKLTDRPPVTICRDNWETLAEAGDESYDNQYRFQAFRTTDWLIRVRQHQDGRTIVYATYCYDTAWQNERSESGYAGVLLTSPSTAEIVSAIHQVANSMEEYGDRRWSQLAAECIGDLPAVELPESAANAEVITRTKQLKELVSQLQADTAGDREAVADARELLDRVISCLNDVDGE